MIVKEGKIEVEVFEGKVSRDLPVFYNPRKRIDRDISIFLLKEILPNDAKVLDMLSASGVYGLRIASELNPKIIYLNDLNPKAYELMKRNLEMNKGRFSCEVKVLNLDAKRLAGKLEERFDYIDIDPFGSPIPFLPSAFLLTRHKGIISVTATDTGALYGTYKSACIRKYHAVPLKIDEAHEIGLRILIKRIVEVASIFNYGIEILFSYWFEHIYRVFFRVLKGERNVKDSALKVAFFKWENGWKFYPIWEGKMESGKLYGPIWIGRLWNPKIAKKVGENFKELKELKEESGISTERNMHYDLHRIAREFKLEKVRKKSEVIKKIGEKGYKASPTIFSKTGIRIDAGFEILREAL